MAGLMGGHSGLNIDEDRGNAVRFAARIADAVLAAAPGSALAAITGGDKRNAIPREASATVLVSAPPQSSRNFCSVARAESFPSRLCTCPGTAMSCRSLCGRMASAKCGPEYTEGSWLAEWLCMRSRFWPRIQDTRVCVGIDAPNT
jgi:hypothetical protein